MTESFIRLECYNCLGLRRHLGQNSHFVEGLFGDRGRQSGCITQCRSCGCRLALGLVLVQRRLRTGRAVGHCGGTLGATVGGWVLTARIQGAGEPGHWFPAAVTGEERATTG